MSSRSVTARHWVRHGRGPVASLVRRATGSAVGTYAAYAVHGLRHPELRVRWLGPEAAAPLPGDALVVSPDIDKTFAVDIATPLERVWPLLVQMGYGRAGWYTWYPFDNGGVASPEGVVDQLQDLEVGDIVPDGPNAYDGFGVWEVAALQPNRHLVLFSRRVPTTGREVGPGEVTDEPLLECSWAFVLTERPHGCRLVVRVRVRVIGALAGPLASVARRFFDVGDTVMNWTMLDGIKARAERAAAGS